jgi:transposase
MEAVLEVLNRPLDKHAPVVALDERPVQLVGSLRPGTAMAPGQPARRDYEYARCGTANVFCVVEPKTGRHQTHATANRTAAKFAGALQRIARRYPAANTIHLVLDNLNTHRETSLTATFGAEHGHQLWERFTVHYTPKHGSWLNPAELEASLWSRQCLGRQGLRRLLSCASAPVPGIGGPIAPNLKSTGASPQLTLVAYSTTNESLPMSRSTSQM